MHEERRDFVALLESLPPEQWDRETLCEGWTVGDMAGHVLAWDDLLMYRTRWGQVGALGRFAWVFATALGNMAVVNRRLQRRTAGLDRDELCRRLHAYDDPAYKWLFDRTSPAAHLMEYVVHHQDVRRPLGLSRDIPPDRLVSALDGVTEMPGLRRAAKRQLRRCHWHATDVDWDAGRGDVVVRAPSEQILMTLAGRSVDD